MAYQTGNASSITDLLSKLASFAENIDGWIIDKFDTVNGSLFIHNKKGYWSFGQTKLEKTIPVMAIAINTSFDSSLKYDKQANSSIDKLKLQYHTQYIGAGTNFHSFPFSSYVFMGTSEYLHVVVRVDTRRFRHFGIGTICKDSVYVGGQYAYGTYADNLVSPGYCALSFTSDCANYGGNGRFATSVIKFEDNYHIFGCAIAGLGAMGLGDTVVNRKRHKHPDSLLVEASFSVFNNTITLVPMSIYLYLSNGQYQRIGIVSDFYVARIDSVAPGTIQEINGEKYYCSAVTIYQTTNINTEDNSYDLGYFYRVVE